MDCCICAAIQKCSEGIKIIPGCERGNYQHNRSGVILSVAPFFDHVKYEVAGDTVFVHKLKKEREGEYYVTR